MRIELRADSVVLEGYVNVPLRESRELYSPTGKFVEVIQPKTFERALAKTDSVDLLFNHDRNRKLGSTKEGNLDLYEDNVGLKAKATIYDKEVMEQAVKGELRGWSFGFSVLKDEWKTREDGMQKRFVEDIELYEVSVLSTTPAYLATSLEMRGEKEVLTEMRTEAFEAKVEDNSGQVEDKTDEKTDIKKVEENREIPEPYYYEILEKEMALTQLKGGF